jgi:predicted O-linked N-acetylglucosamine transferase (SPINDLY family)
VRRLRIGCVSPDFRDHPVTSFIEPILRQHHREDFETFCYANVKAPDAVTQRLRLLAGQWRDIHGWNPDQVAELVRQDGIDILPRRSALANRLWITQSVWIIEA